MAHPVDHETQQPKETCQRTCRGPWAPIHNLFMNHPFCDTLHCDPGEPHIARAKARKSKTTGKVDPS